MFIHLQYENGHTNIHQFWSFCLMHADMTGVITKSKIGVSNEVKDKSWYQPQPQPLILTPDHAMRQTPD